MASRAVQWNQLVRNPHCVQALGVASGYARYLLASGEDVCRFQTTKGGFSKQGMEVWVSVEGRPGERASYTDVSRGPVCIS